MAKFLVDWLTYIESLHASSIELGLERIQQVYQRLALGVFTCPVVSIAGTNGKGSTLVCLEQLALSHGLRVGAYTSPHILQFNERIRISGQPVSDVQLCEAFALIEAKRSNVPLTYFEFTTLAALICFHQAQLDCVLLEVGLGGRLDAVNIVDADISVITSIGLDHQDWLGNTIDAIAREKAGILRADRPCVYAEPVVPNPILEQVERLGCAFFGGPNFSIEESMQNTIVDSSWDLTVLTPERASLWLEQLPMPNMVLTNAAAALQVWMLLTDRLSFEFDLGRIKQVLARVQIPGRWQPLDEQGAIILDVAHNVPAVEQLKQRILRESDGCRVIALFGAMKDKDIPGMIKVMDPVVSQWCVLQLDDPRAADLAAFRSMFSDLSVSLAHEFQTIEQAWSVLRDEFDAQRDQLVIFGSFGMAEAAISLLNGSSGVNTD